MANRALNLKSPLPEQLALDFFASDAPEKAIDSAQARLKKNTSPQAHNPKDKIKVRYSQRAKRMSISVAHNGEVELIAPGRKYRRPSLPRIRNFAAENKDWILKTSNNFRNKIGIPITQDRPDELDLKYLDQVIRIHYTDSLNHGNRTLLERDGQIYIAAKLSNQEVAKKLGVWLAKKAKQILLPELARRAKLCNLYFQKASIRGQKSRWGSCSSKGNISLNYCILLLPRVFGDYVLIHELCHLQHFNHSKRFWALVKQFEPDYLRIDRAINDHWIKLPSWLDLRHSKSNSEEVIYITL